MSSMHNLDHWARITVRHDIQHDHPYPLFEGAFSYQGEIYHITTKTNYHLYKRHDDPHLPDHWPLVIYRDSDIHDDEDDDIDRIPYSSLPPLAHDPNPPYNSNQRLSSLQVLSSRSLPQRGNMRHQSNRSSHTHDDIMCAMEELTYNRKLTGTLPFGHLKHNQTRSQDSNETDDDGDDDRDNDDSNQVKDSDDTNGDDEQPNQPSQIPEVLWNKKKRSLITESLRKRDAPISQGCPNSRKIAFMGAAADCSYVKSYGGIRLARIQMITDWNVASAVYERTFNISLGLIYMQMSTPQCPQQPSQLMNWNQDCSNYYTINNRLSDFSFWRGQRGADQAALWHLMTKCSTGVKVGIAWLSQLCEYQASQQIEDNGSYDWVSGTGVSSTTREEWKVVAHEIGHGFGAIHDCSSQSCACQSGCSCCPLSPTKCSAGETYLMNPTSNVSTNDFSPCSITDICSSFPNIGYCLKSPGDVNNSTFSMCGNGILEPGEQCDPGHTDSPCCFAKNCTLKAGATCDDYSSQCCLNCNTAPKDTVCRPAVSECDTEEVCTGLTSQCPPDIYDPDGTSCANGTMQCASGVCTSRDEQCTARGLRLNISKQCPFQEDSCNISCADPSDTQNCLVLSGMFLDGTECGLAGFCRSGKCVGSGFSNTVRAWVNKNKNIAIPVFIFGGLFILGVLALIVWYILRRYRQKKLASGKDKNSRPSSLASSHHDGVGGGTGGGGGPGSGLDYFANRDVAFGAMTGSRGEVPERTNPFLAGNNSNNNNNNNNNSTRIAGSNQSIHSSFGSQRNSSTAPTTTVGSSLPSDSWELQTFENTSQDLQRQQQSYPTESSFSVPSAGISPLQQQHQQHQPKALDLTINDLSAQHLDHEHALYEPTIHIGDEHHHHYSTNPFPVSRRSHHPSSVNSYHVPTTAFPTSPTKDSPVIMTNNPYDQDQPPIAMTTGSHRRASSNLH
ncbi:unnamed protein product [Absidia cylindrospora]